MKVKFGAWISDFNGLLRIKNENLGNSVGIELPDNYQEALRTAEFCRENQIYFIFRELIHRNKHGLPAKELFAGKLTPEELRGVIEAAGEFYMGRVILGESGGMLYWPFEYLHERAEGEYSLLPQDAVTLPEAESLYLDRLSAYTAEERVMGGEPFWDVDSSMCFKHHIKIGVTVPYLEMMPGNPERMTAALRGAARAAGGKEFGALIAFGWYGGGLWDGLYFKRWKASLYFSYLAGLTCVHSESGHFGFDRLGNKIADESPEAGRFRDVMREFAAFCAEDERPDDGPEVRVGIVYGHLDGYPGLWSNSVWGQYANAAFKCGDAEKSWSLLDTFYQARPWHDNLNTGGEDLSGQPALGLYDIVPAKAPAEALQKYSCLIMLGWNTMTKELYEKFRTYVENGGHLIASLPHFRTNIKRGEPFTLINGGDMRDLFGVRINGEDPETVTGVKFTGEAMTAGYKFPCWTESCDPKFIGKGFKAGRIAEGAHNTLAVSGKYFFPSNRGEKRVPVLLENRCGKGSAFLINAWEYPGNENLFDFVRVVILTAMKAERPSDISVVCGDKIRHAVYRMPNGQKTLYLLNTDFEFANSCRIKHAGEMTELCLKQLETRKIIF
jgi:hypothetical protein